MPYRNRVGGVVCAGAIVVGGCLGEWSGGLSEAAADVEISVWNSATSYEQVVSHMPDLDQKRAGLDFEGGLPGDGGAYCVPTALMNLLAYAANHGFPEQLPGPGGWSSTERYIEMSEYLRLAGSLMNTHPVDGTSHSPAVFGMLILTANPGRFVIDHGAASGNYAPTINTLAAQMEYGGIVATCYGRYDLLAEGGDVVQVGSRRGGHCTTVVHAKRSGDNLVLKVRDPASGGGSEYTQSSYANREMNASNRSVISLSPIYVRNMTAIDYVPGSGQERIALLDSYIAIRPKVMYDWEASAPFRIRLRVPFPMAPEYPIVRFQPINLDAGARIRQLIMSTDERWAALVVDDPLGDDQIGYAELVDGSFVHLGDVPTGAQVTVDRFGCILALADGNLLIKFDPAADDPMIAELDLPEPVSSFVYRDARDELIMYSPMTRTIQVADRHIQNPPERIVLPAGIPLAPDGMVKINPKTDRIWIQPQGIPRLYEIIQNEDDSIEWNIVGLPCPMTDFDFDDEGHLFLACDGSVEEFEETAPGVWNPVDISPSGLNGQPVGATLQISRSNTAWDRDTMDNPGWHDIPADEVVIGSEELDCPGDNNNDGVVDVTDLLALLGAWGDCGVCAEDTNFDNTIDVVDLLALLANWGDC